MKSLATDKWWRVFPSYPLGGLVLGLADALLGGWVQQLGLRPGMATAASVNILLPLLAIGIAVAHQRLGVACLGAAGMTAGFLLGLAMVYPPALPWDAGTLLRSIPPVLVLACVGYAVLGTLTALAARAVWK
jgi:hypothetical protein